MSETTRDVCTRCARPVATTDDMCRDAEPEDDLLCFSDGDVRLCTDHPVGTVNGDGFSLSRKAVTR